MPERAAQSKPVALDEVCPPGEKPAAMPSPPPVKRLKKGELLFSEGENSRAMYLLKSGVIRLFKKKGNSEIEIDTVHSGQILGELAFLDGNPRSASGETLTDCVLTEISGPAFQEAVARMPDWLKMLLKTVVGRLRTASTRIRQLESSSSCLDYSAKDGQRSSHYVYLSAPDAMKIASGLLLVGTRNGIVSPQGLDLRIGLVQRYCNQVMGVPVAKITSFIDLLAQAGVMTVVEERSQEKSKTRTILKDMDFLEELIAYLNEENQLENAKRHDISPRSFHLMSLIHKHLHKFAADPDTGISTVNLAEIAKAEITPEGKPPFRMSELAELIQRSYMTDVNAKSTNEMFTAIDALSFTQAYRFQRICLAIQALNESKRKSGGK